MSCVRGYTRSVHFVEVRRFEAGFLPGVFKLSGECGEFASGLIQLFFERGNFRVLAFGGGGEQGLSVFEFIVSLATCLSIPACCSLSCFVRSAVFFEAGFLPLASLSCPASAVSLPADLQQLFERGNFCVLAFGGGGEQGLASLSSLVSSATCLSIPVCCSLSCFCEVSRCF